MATITSLLQAILDGSDNAEDRLYARVYEALKQVAAHQIQMCRPAGTSATALVNEAYERLATREGIAAADRKHFFFLFSRAMHDVLVDQIRRDLAEKRGGKLRRVPMWEIAVDGQTQQVDSLDLQEALSELSVVDPEAARIVMLRFYGGLTLDDAAEASNQSLATVRKHWEYARAWMHDRLTDGLKRINNENRA